MRLLLVAAVLVLLMGCDEKGMPTSGGRAYEVLVTGSDRDGVEATAEALRSIVAEALPQSEPAFDVSSLTAETLDKGIRHARNIVVVKTDSTELQHTHISVAHDVYAQPQTVVLVAAPSFGRLMAELPRIKQPLADELTRGEMNNAIKTLRNSHDEMATRAVDSIFGCRLWVATDIRKILSAKDFLWLTDDGPTVMQSVCVYRVVNDTLMGSSAIGNAQRLLDIRDSVMSRNLRTERPGWNMQTLRPSVLFRRGNPSSTVGARGLWQMDSTAMGGPFVCLWRQVGDSILAVDAFVYAPGQKKRNLMRRLEASLYTLNIKH